MHSRFRVTNWSDRLGLDVGAPGLLRVPGGEKKGGEEELRWGKYTRANGNKASKVRSFLCHFGL